MNELIYLPRNQAPDSLFGYIDGLYLITPSWRNTPYIGKYVIYEHGMKTASGATVLTPEQRGYLVHNENGEVFFPAYDINTLGVFINAQVAR